MNPIHNEHNDIQRRIVCTLIRHLNDLDHQCAVPKTVIVETTEEVHAIDKSYRHSLESPLPPSVKPDPQIEHLLEAGCIADVYRYFMLVPSAAPACFHHIRNLLEKHVIIPSKAIVTKVGYTGICAYINDFLNENGEIPEIIQNIEGQFLPLRIHTEPLLGNITTRISSIHKIDPEEYLNHKFAVLRYLFKIIFTYEGHRLVVVGFFPNQAIRPLFQDHKIRGWVEDRVSSLNTEVYNSFFKKILEDNDVQDSFLLLSDNKKDVMYHLYQSYTRVSQNTFMDNMKVFLDPETTVLDMFMMIKFLLMGTKEQQNVAYLLFGLIKDKKSKEEVTYAISMLFFNNLSQTMQHKLISGNDHLEEELKRIKDTSLNSVDLKTQIIMHSSMPAGVKQKAIEKVDEMRLSVADTSKQMVYVKTLLSFPWTSSDEGNDRISCISRCDKGIQRKYIQGVMDSLDKAIYGQTRAKKTLLYFLTKWISNPQSSGGSIGLVGSPGVGKTMVAQTIAKSMGIPFVQLTLGGQNDGELLHGHGYTYNTSTPGMIVRKMAEAGHPRCVFLFDELDKCTSKAGTINEIMSILIHITDPNMNSSFQDRFFQGIDFPIDKALIIVSYNDESVIDRVLLDRLIKVEMNSFTHLEKISIAHNFIVPKLIKEANLCCHIQFSDDNIAHIIREYTHEAGVRGLKNMLSKVVLHHTLECIKSDSEIKDSYSNAEIDKIIGSGRATVSSLINDSKVVGSCHCLYVTKMGSGGVGTIQVVGVLGVRNLTSDLVTGSIGKVMNESIQCALTATQQYRTKTEPMRFHVHMSNANQPKDGASAGAAFALALSSIFMDKPIPQDVAVSGEIDLTGKIHPVKDIVMKIDGAIMSGIRQVYCSSDTNEVDKEEISNLFDKSHVEYVSTVDELVCKVFN